MDTECITLSDDDEVEFIECIYNLEPTCVDLTEEEELNSTLRQSSPPNHNNHNNHNNHHSPTPSPPPQQTSQHNPFQPQSQFYKPHPWPPHPQHPAPPHAEFYQPRPPPPQPDFFKPTLRRPNLIFSQPRQPPPPPPPPQPDFSKPTLRRPNRQPPPPPPPPPNPQLSQVRPPQPPPKTSAPPPVVETQQIPQAQPPQEQPRQLELSDRDLLLSQKTLGNEKYRKNQFDEAIRIYKRCNEIAKRLGDIEMSAILHFNLAMSYCNLRSYDQAADECSNAVKLDDNYIKAHLKRAEIYQRQLKFEEAVICYEHICELDRTNYDYITLLNKAREAAKHTQKKDYFAILGLKTNCTKQELKKAYRQSALKHHPDRHSNADIVTRRIEEKYFKDASEAHTFIQKRFSNY